VLPDSVCKQQSARAFALGRELSRASKLYLTSPERNEGAERCDAPRIQLPRPENALGVYPIRANKRDAYRLAALRFSDLTTRAALFVKHSRKNTSPSAVLPAGEPSLAGRCPAPSRLAPAKSKRRRRPFPALSTPRENALGRKWRIGI
jgi:hypothetical protein